MLLGAHVGTSGGLVQAIHNALALDIQAIQIFGSSPMQWRAKLPDKENAELFKKERKAKGIEKVYLHAPYLINLASQKPQTRHLSRELLAQQLRIANAIGADGVIYHSGSAGTQDMDQALAIAIEAVKRILREVPQGTLLVENAAGAGALIGDSIPELACMIKKVGSDRFGLCIDTCHALASGMIESFEPKNIRKLEMQIKKNIGAKKLLAVHLNDSKFPYNQKKDRHENIGEGYIGKEGFRNFLNNPFFAKRPLILEVPGFEGTGPDKKNVQIVRSLM